ncbi:hypothetical protein HK101_005598, partial [Irineochytrium annulatum]
MLGAWYERPTMYGQTPSDVNGNLTLAGMTKPGLTFFQIDLDLSGMNNPENNLTVTDQLMQHLQATNTDAFAYITLYPFAGFGNVTDAIIAEIGTRVNALINAGHDVFIRYAPEMNGSWFVYGQNPSAFIAAWIRMVTAVRTALGPNASKVAFIWAPNSGNGYPYPGELASPNVTTTPSDATRVAEMDTNHNGVLDALDDAYLPYYPGDEYVDWVGLSIYHYGIKWPWVNNSIPDPTEFEGFMNGNQAAHPEWGTFHFYDYFSGPNGVANITAGNKPFIVAETGASFHYGYSEQGLKDGYTGVPSPTPDRVAIKQAWWRSFLNTEFLAKYPKFKAVCTFEWIKSEEETLRDFTSFGPPTTAQGFPDDINVAKAFVADTAKMSFIQWANAVAPVSTTAKSGGMTSGAATASATVSSSPGLSTKTSAAAAISGNGVGAGIMVASAIIAFV